MGFGSGESLILRSNQHRSLVWWFQCFSVHMVSWGGSSASHFGFGTVDIDTLFLLPITDIEVIKSMGQWLLACRWKTRLMRQRDRSTGREKGWRLHCPLTMVSQRASKKAAETTCMRWGRLVINANHQVRSMLPCLLVTTGPTGGEA